MFRLKKFLMTKIIGIKQKKQPFNYQEAENFIIPESEDGTFNNSYYFSAHCPDKQQSLYVRLGLRGDNSAEVWAFFCTKDKWFYHEKLLYTAQSSPLKVILDNGAWSFKFDGELTGQKGEKFNGSFDCSFSSNAKAVDFFHHMPASRVGTAMAQDKWTKEYFKGVQENNSVHYEQEGRLNGTVIIGEQTYPIDLPCLRDHSYGRRVWDYMNNHLWLGAVSNDCTLNFSMVSYPSMSILEEGHVRIKDGPTEFVTKISYDRNEIVTGEIPKQLTLNAQIDGKRTITITANLICAVPYVFENGAYTLIEGIAEYEVDKIKCRGILEIGFNKDKSRFMNGKKISEIRE